MQPLVLNKFESFYIGGTVREVESAAWGMDKQLSGQMYVQQMAPAERRFPLPVIFIHGGMHSGVTWETTPDGREGWQTLFVRGGFETFVVDQAWRGRSVPDLTCLNPMIKTTDTIGAAFTCGMNVATLFSRGGDRFPSHELQHYAAQLCPDFGLPAAQAAGNPGLSDPRALPPLLELLDRVGPAVLITHSQGGDLGWKLAIARPDKVAAILTIEPGLTTPGLYAPGFPEIPVYVMWGDHLSAEAPVLSLRDVEQARAIAAKHPSVIVDLLPEHGITGNGHMLMMENNNAELATRAMGWFFSIEKSAKIS